MRKAEILVDVADEDADGRDALQDGNDADAEHEALEFSDVVGVTLEGHRGGGGGCGVVEVRMLMMMVVVGMGRGV